jgi:dsRNA-specific ribonuclease
LTVNYPDEELIAAYHIESIAKSCPFTKDTIYDRTVDLLPEFIQILPLPRDFLYTYGLAAKFMPLFERLVDNASHADALLRMHDSAVSEASTSYYEALFPLLDEATTTYPIATFERLEYLGDAVLGHCLALDIWTINHTLTRDCEELGGLISAAGKNTTLAQACHRIGLTRLVYSGQRKWVTAYRLNEQVGSNSVCFKGEFPDTRLSDVVESVMAATYVAGRQSSRLAIASNLTKCFYERLCLLPKGPDEDSFAGICLNSGFPFNATSPWSRRLMPIRKLIGSCSSLASKLDKCADVLVQKLFTESNMPQHSCIDQRDDASLLIRIALFDNDLEDSSLFRTNGARDPNSMNDYSTIQSIGYLRDSLYEVGAHAFRLKLSEEVYFRFPDAKPKELHLLRNVVIADDVVAYVMLKSGLREALYDDSSYDLECKMALADVMGNELWEKNGGWVIEGGVEEFRRRSKVLRKTSDMKHEASELVPRYVGIGGGRFVGHSKKLEQDLTDGIMFSFKAIVGALVLSIGVDEMWHSIGPFFDELLLLLPSELKALYASCSTLVASAKV